jgi:hypothetical protein
MRPLIHRSEVRDALNTAAEATGFEYMDEPREGCCFEYANASSNEPDMELSITWLNGTGMPGSLVITPKGYDLYKLPYVRQRAMEFAKELKAYGAVVEMPAAELEQALLAIARIAKPFELVMELRHGYDGHADAIGLELQGERCLCLRFADGRFIIHYFEADDESIADTFAHLLAENTGYEVDVE